MPVHMILLPGDCEEALNFYRDILGGEVTIVNRYDNPAMNAPEDYKNRQYLVSGITG